MKKVVVLNLDYVHTRLLMNQILFQYLNKSNKMFFFHNLTKKISIYIPAPAPATPTVAAPAPIYLAAESISRRIAEVDIVR